MTEKELNRLERRAFGVAGIERVEISLIELEPLIRLARVGLAFP